MVDMDSDNMDSDYRSATLVSVQAVVKNVKMCVFHLIYIYIYMYIYIYVDKTCE
jgi:hypothetical protein